MLPWLPRSLRTERQKMLLLLLLSMVRVVIWIFSINTITDFDTALLLLFLLFASLRAYPLIVEFLLSTCRAAYVYVSRDKVLQFPLPWLNPMTSPVDKPQPALQSRYNARNQFPDSSQPPRKTAASTFAPLTSLLLLHLLLLLLSYSETFRRINRGFSVSEDPAMDAAPSTLSHSLSHVAVTGLGSALKILRLTHQVTSFTFPHCSAVGFRLNSQDGRSPLRLPTSLPLHVLRYPSTYIPTARSPAAFPLLPRWIGRLR